MQKLIFFCHLFPYQQILSVVTELILLVAVDTLTSQPELMVQSEDQMGSDIHNITSYTHLICWWWRWVWLGVRIPCWCWPGSGTGRWFPGAAVWSCVSRCSRVTTPARADAAAAPTGRTNAHCCSWSEDTQIHHIQGCIRWIFFLVLHNNIQRSELLRVCTHGARENTLLILKHSGLHTNTQI